jgi:hypothetical protein
MTWTDIMNLNLTTPILIAYALKGPSMTVDVMQKMTDSLIKYFYKRFGSTKVSHIKIKIERLFTQNNGITI